jgi:carotenoid cleavage dioxygenase
MALIERRAAQRCDLVVLDTKNFEKPIAIVQLPFHVKSQVHGNWVEAKRLKTQKSLVRQMGELKISGQGALEPLI